MDHHRMHIQRQRELISKSKKKIDRDQNKSQRRQTAKISN